MDGLTVNEERGGLQEHRVGYERLRHDVGHVALR